MWVSDAVAGHLFRVTRAPGALNYTLTPHVTEGQFGGVLGLSVSDDGSTLYAAARLPNGTHVIIAMGTDPASAGVYTVLATLPKSGNGLRLWQGIIYTSTEGDFLPGDGAVYAVDPANPGTFETLSQGALWAADGLWISSGGQLFVGELFALRLWSRSLASGGGNATVVPGPSQGGWLDDFTLDEGAGDGTGLFYGANFDLGRIDTWWENGTMDAASPLVGNLTNPTSCRFGDGSPAFPASSLYITEGGGLFAAWQKDRRVWELQNAR